MAIQTFEDLVNFHPHLHAIVSDGAFAANGWFYALPKVNPNHLEAAFRHRVLTMLRPLFSQQELWYLAKSKSVIYRSKMHRVLKRNFEVFPVLDWLAALTVHIPNHGEHLVPSSAKIWFHSPKIRLVVITVGRRAGRPDVVPIVRAGQGPVPLPPGPAVLGVPLPLTAGFPTGLLSGS